MENAQLVGEIIIGLGIIVSLFLAVGLPLIKMEHRLTSIENKLESIDKTLGGHSSKIEEHEKRLDDHDKKFIKIDAETKHRKARY